MPVDRYFSVFKTASRGLEAQRRAMGASAENLANANTTRTPEGTPYQIKRAVHESPNTRYNTFYNLLNKMQSDMEQPAQSHRDGSSLNRLLEDGQLGPETAIEAEEKYRLEYDPSHPHAEPDGYVRYPDVNLAEEMSRMVSANRIYEANLSAIDAAKNMIKHTLEI
jgi:flagellar basal-body rod protein FlgC